MPHLSPLNWIMMFISMTSMILIMNSNFWWKPKTKFSLANNKFSKSHTTWNW